MPIELHLLTRFTRPPKGGAEIRASFDKPPVPRCPVVSEFLYKRKLTYLIADPGLGKSTVAVQVAFSVAAAVPVFGLLEVPKPVPIYYVSFETDWDEFQESCDIIRRYIPYDPDLVKFDEDMLGVDITNVDHAKFLLEKIVKYKPGLVIIDPLYLAVAGDLKDGAVASSLANWMRLVAVRADAPVMALHHTHKERPDINGKPSTIKDRSYGSRWLKASATLWWQMSELPTQDGVFLENLKDRYKLSRKSMSLKYDPSSRCVMGQTGGKDYLIDQLSKFIDFHKPGTELSFSTMAEVLECSTNYIYELTRCDQLKGRLERTVKPDRTVVWKVAPQPVRVGQPAPQYTNGAPAPATPNQETK